MVQVSLSMLRKRSEHNDGILSNLEEIALHQLDITDLGQLPVWCPRLKILLLQGNLLHSTGKIGRLRELVYLNLALNNLEDLSLGSLVSCEALVKLDLTANFLADLLGTVTVLQELPSLQELYLTGNPLCQYSGYRLYTVASLPLLQELDGEAVCRHERITALQGGQCLEEGVMGEQRRVLENRELQKRANEDVRTRETTRSKGCDSAADSTSDSAADRTSDSAADSTSDSAADRTTDSAADSTSDSAADRTSDSAADSTSDSAAGSTNDSAADRTSDSAAGSTNDSAADRTSDSEDDSQFSERWQTEISDHCPETRLAMHEELRKRRERQERRSNASQSKEKISPSLYTRDGRPLNVNQAKLDFKFTEDEDRNAFILEVFTYKHLDPSLLQLDVEPSLVRVTVKGKVLQLVLPEEVKADSAKARRSQATGHLQVFMHKVMDNSLYPRLVHLEASSSSSRHRAEGGGRRQALFESGAEDELDDSSVPPLE